ncbi:TetR/AcrR family transcriptional regulator [Winogradskya consettensis]|uniref:TetR family transcriptional regulator n=1 Tax=Winogradskya consettensis TaxID=113560 RepID=A0A919VZK7_9ACTN|nr:TetR/AcrR family transcriptional regulator [Actinoplanes consettensis]GIM82098.1 TetR family transcriptional regulator [Actinoplanes consettensis]
MVLEPELRADARRNLRQIIATAREIFVESGLDVPMEAIARRAGVGVGTLYRRFPDRGGLIAAVAASTFRAVLVDLRAAVDATASAWDAFIRLATTSENLVLTVHLAFPSPQVWTPVHAAEESRDVYREMMTALDRLVRDAQREGSLRADVGSGDVLGLVSFVLERLPPVSDPAGRLRAQRSLWLVLDGLGARPGSRLPGSPVSLAELGGEG